MKILLKTNKGKHYAIAFIMAFSLMLNVGLKAESIPVNIPVGRIAFSSNGNLHDSDDWGDTAFSLAIIHYAGLSDRFVHYDCNNHLCKSRQSWEQVMDDAAKGGAKRFGLNVSGNFESACKLLKQDLEEYIKFFQEGSTKTPEKRWQWGIRAEKNTTIFTRLFIILKKEKITQSL